MARHRIRLVFVLISGAALVLGGLTPADAVSGFGTKIQVDGASQYSWLDGDPAMATSVNKAGDTILHVLYASDYAPDGTFVDDAGPYLGVYYRKTKLDGAGNPTTWSAPFMVNGAYHAERITLAASGKYLYAAWADQPTYWSGNSSTFDPTDPRQVSIRVNSKHGAPGAWGSEMTLSGASDRADYVWSDAASTNVFVTWTEADTGDIMVARSLDRGVNWDIDSIDTTAATDFTTGYVEGFSGLSAIGTTNGTNVGLSYIDTAGGAVVSRISTDAGANWGSATTLQSSGGADNNGYPQVDGSGKRIAFTWSTVEAAKLKIYKTNTASYGATRTIADCTATVLGKAYDGCEGAAVALSGTTTVGVALSLCYGNVSTFPCDWTDINNRESLIWYESSDNGASFASPIAVQLPGPSKCTWQNDFADVVLSGGKAYVYWNGWDAGYICYHDYLKVGS